MNEEKDHGDAFCYRCNRTTQWHIHGTGVFCSSCGMLLRRGNELSGAKDTAGKPRYSLLPRKGCEAVIAVREFGTAKYHGDSENWRKVPQREWAEAVVRHAMAFLSGEVNDPESGKHHLAHAACSALLWCSVEEP